MTISDSLEFNVDLSTYSGSLEVLLDLAKSQKVDLEKISITKLADQFYDYITKVQNVNYITQVCGIGPMGFRFEFRSAFCPSVKE